MLTAQEALARVERRRQYMREYMRHYSQTPNGREAITRARLRAAFRQAGLPEAEIDRLTAEHMSMIQAARDGQRGVENGGD